MGKSLASINTLQALTLRTLYEFKQPNFARTRMTLGRPIRLAKMMGLGDADGYGYSRAGTVVEWGVRLQLPPPSDPEDTEERRRTFWVLYIFDAFSNTQTNELSALERPVCPIAPSPSFTLRAVANSSLQMHVPLPSPSDYPDEAGDSRSAPSRMPCMRQILDSDIPIDVPLSSFAGNTATVCLYRRCIEHMTSSQSPAKVPHAFWKPTTPSTTPSLAPGLALWRGM